MGPALAAPRPLIPNFAFNPSTAPDGLDAVVAFGLRHHGVAAPTRILVIADGVNDVAAALAAHGHEVSRADIPPPLSRAANNGRPSRYAIADIDTLVVDEPVDGVVWLGGGIGALDVGKIRVVFNLFAAAVRPGGWLMLDCRLEAEVQAPRRPHALSRAPAGPDGSRSTSAAAMTVGELACHLAEAGWRSTGLFSGPDGAVFVPGDAALLLMAARTY